MESYKDFPINTKEDAIVYLQFIIMNVDVYLHRLKDALADLYKVIECHGLHLDATKTVDSSLLFASRDRIGFIKMYLVNIMGDHAKSAVSYKKFRETIERKKNRGEDWGLEELENEYNCMLREFNSLRNWGAHVPESLISSQLEAIRKRLQVNPTDYVIQNCNPISVERYQKVTGATLIETYMLNKEKYNEFRFLLQRIKRDYSKLIGSSVRISLKQIGVIDFHNGFEVSQDSWAMQNKKYKGENNC